MQHHARVPLRTHDDVFGSQQKLDVEARTQGSKFLELLPRDKLHADLEPLRAFVASSLRQPRRKPAQIAAMLDAAMCSLLLPEGPIQPGTDPLQLVADAVENVASPVCGYIFKNGDIAWVCRTCQTDDTCVLCQECFSHERHAGHDVFFHRTRAGGCCDCGDLEAFKAEGCCPRHRGGGGEGGELPERLAGPARIVAQEIARCATAATAADFFSPRATFFLHAGNERERRKGSR